MVVNETFLEYNRMIDTTFGKISTSIKDIYAVYVFKPEKARGQNGVMLKEYLGIADVRKLLVQFDKGVDEDLAMFPVCIPKIVPSMLFNEVSTMMIAGIWRRSRTILPEEKWTLLACFNVLQHFCFQASTNHKQRDFYLQ